jgi:hypothetical protein
MFGVFSLNRTTFSGMAIFLVVFLGGLSLTHNLMVALILGAGTGIGGGFIVNGLFPYDASLVDYRLDAQRRVRKLNQLLDSIERMARKVRDRSAQASITRGSKVIRDVVAKTQEQDPSQVASTVAKLNGYVSSVNGILATYLLLQEDPAIPGNLKSMQDAQEGFTNFQQTAEDRMAQALSGDLLQMRTDLDSLKPLPKLTI